MNADCYYLKLVCLRQRLRNDELSPHWQTPYRLRNFWLEQGGRGRSGGTLSGAVYSGQVRGSTLC